MVERVAVVHLILVRFQFLGVLFFFLLGNGDV